MILEPILPLVCDNCKDEVYLEMTMGARGAYDSRYADEEIENMGWYDAGNNTHYCHECAIELGYIDE